MIDRYNRNAILTIKITSKVPVNLSVAILKLKNFYKYNNKGNIQYLNFKKGKNSIIQLIKRIFHRDYHPKENND